MRILLTGATGFIGSAVLKLAALRGHEIAALVRPEKLSHQAATGVHWMGGTLADAPWDKIQPFGPDTCIHTAWITTPGIYLESPENDVWVEETEAFVKRAASAGVQRVLALGTCIEYQMTGGPLAEETTPLAPASRYGRSKDTLRRRLELAAAHNGFSFAWGRVFYPYGPGEHSARLCSSAIRQLRSGKPLVLQNPESVKDYIFIEDLAAAILAVAESDVSGPINLGSGVEVRIGEIARTIAELLGRPGLIRESETSAPDPFPFVVANSTRLRALGWTPQVALRDGLARLINEVDT